MIPNNQFWFNNKPALINAVIYNQTFNSGIAPNFSTNVGSDWVLDDTALPVSNGYTGASGSFYYANANAVIGIPQTLTLSGINTTGYSSITIQWGAYAEPGFPINTMTLEWSPNGSVWNNVSFTNVLDNSVWALVPLISLPSGVNNLTNLRLRWTTMSDGSLIPAAIDDITIYGFH